MSKKLTLAQHVAAFLWLPAMIFGGIGGVFGLMWAFVALLGPVAGLLWFYGFGSFLVAGLCGYWIMTNE